MCYGGRGGDVEREDEWGRKGGKGCVLCRYLLKCVCRDTCMYVPSVS